MTEDEMKQKEIELELREKNLKSQQHIAMVEHTTVTQMIPRITQAIMDKLEENKEGRMARIETLVEVGNKNTEATLRELIKAKNEHADRITTLEAQKNTAIWFIGILSPLLGAAGAYLLTKII